MMTSWKTFLLVAVVIGLTGAGAWADESAATTQPEGLVDWPGSGFVHPPLKVMSAYRRITAFPVMAWCFHGREPKGRYDFNADYVRDLKQAGFNSIIDDPRMLAPAREVGGMMVMVVAFWGNQKEIIAQDFKEFGDPSSLIGFVLDDNCPSVTRAVIDVSNELTKTHPHLVPFISENPDPKAQSATRVRVLGTQNYPFLRGYRGYWRRRGSYCYNLDVDRRCSNAWNMSFWPLFGGHKNTPSQYRFQVLAAMAYGAQGVIHFAYTPHRAGIWYPPENPFRLVAADVNNYAWQVVGRHTWGTRCAGVYHFAGNNDSPKGHLVPGADQPVVKLDRQILAGMLTVESKFETHPEPGAADYVLMVDKRTSRGGEPDPLEGHLVLGRELAVVEVLDREAAGKRKVRKFQPGCMVHQTLRGGDGVLLAVNPPGFEQAVGGREIAELYRTISRNLITVQTQDSPDLPAAMAQAAKDQRKLKDLLDAAVKSGEVSQAQADDTRTRLAESIETIAKVAKAAAEEEAKKPVDAP